MAEKNFNKTNSDQQEKVLEINRVTKVVKGGKNMRFRAAVIVGDLKGKVGFGVSKSIEVPKAIRKAIESAKKSQININLSGTSIAHDVEGKYEASRVILRPARKGTGVIAGGSIRAVLELAGIKDVVAKSKGSNSPINSARATLVALGSLMNRESVEKLRGIKIGVTNVSEKTISIGDKVYNNAKQAVAPSA